MALRSPVDFDVAGPKVIRGDGVVLTEADAAGVGDFAGEPCPTSEARAGAVGSYDVAGAEILAIGMDESGPARFWRLRDALD